MKINKIIFLIIFILNNINIYSQDLYPIEAKKDKKSNVIKIEDIFNKNKKVNNKKINNKDSIYYYNKIDYKYCYLDDNVYCIIQTIKETNNNLEVIEHELRVDDRYHRMNKIARKDFEDAYKRISGKDWKVK